MSVTGSFARELRSRERGMPAFMRAEARLATDQLVDECAQRTPVGRIVDPATGRDLGPSGNLRAAWRGKRPVKAGNSYIAVALNPEKYASYVNDGTKAHIISGNLNLAFWTAAQLVIVRRVRHPGAPGHFMAEQGQAAVDAGWAAQADPRLEAFLA